MDDGLRGAVVAAAAAMPAGAGQLRRSLSRCLTQPHWDALSPDASAAPLAHGRARTGAQPRRGARCASTSASSTSSPASSRPTPCWPAWPVRVSVQPTAMTTRSAAGRAHRRALTCIGPCGPVVVLRDRDRRPGSAAATWRLPQLRAARPAGALDRGARSAGERRIAARGWQRMSTARPLLTGLRAGGLVATVPARNWPRSASLRACAAACSGWARRRRSFVALPQAGRRAALRPAGSRRAAHAPGAA